MTFVSFKERIKTQEHVLHLMAVYTIKFGIYKYTFIDITCRIYTEKEISKEITYVSYLKL